MDDIMTAEAVPSRQFKIYTGILKASGSEEEGMTLSGVASSSIKDHHGDLMLESAIRDMEVQASQGLTVFLNHEYKVPEDVAGSSTGARVVNRGTDGDGNAVWDLDLDIDINSENPRAVEAWRSIRKKGTKLGLSIGANIPKDGFEINDDGRYDISHVNLLETSIVGIPANPRSWISKAVDSLPELPDPDEIVEEVKAEELEEAPPADDRADVVVLDEDGTEQVEAETSPEQPDGQEDDKPEAESDPDEVVPLEGETAVVSAAIESLEKVDGEVTLTHLQMAVDIARSAVERNAELVKEKGEALQAKAEADRERDEAVEGTGKILAGVHELLEELGNTPLGRKTAPAAAKAERKLKHLEATYGPEFMKMLEM